MGYGTKVGGIYIVCALLRIFIFFGFCKVKMFLTYSRMSNLAHGFFFLFFFGSMFSVVAYSCSCCHRLV